MVYKIAAASSNGKEIDLHFGQLQSVRIYSVNDKDGSFSFDEERTVNRVPEIVDEKAETGCSCDDIFVRQVASSVTDCVYLLVAKIGNRPYRLLQVNNVNCVEAPFPLDEAISKLNTYYVAHRDRENHIF